MTPERLSTSLDGLALGSSTGNHTSDPAQRPLGNAKRRHYLKKLLLTKLVEDELSSLSDPRTLEQFGPPFRQSSCDAIITATNTNLPILHFVFRKFVCTFPFLLKTDQDVFWQEKVQTFMEAFSSKRISSSEDRAESTKRAKLAQRIRSMLVLLMNTGVRAGKEETITIEAHSKEESKAVSGNTASEEKLINGFLVNIAGVRTMQKSHKVRRRETHSEFIVSTKKTLHEKEEVIVARRYGAFKKLHAQLKEEFPGKQVPRLPMKNKAPSSSYMPSMSAFGLGGPAVDEDSGESADEEAPTSPTGTKIPREKQRLTLRSFLRRLLKDAQIAQSTSLRHFLYDAPIKLSAPEERDCRHRHDLDALRHEEQMRFLSVARARAQDLDAQMDIFKQQLIRENGLTRIFRAIKTCQTVEELPTEYIRVIEWGRIEVAATLYQLFVADDNASEMFAQAKRVHSLFPYAVLKNIMRFSNPMTMMRAGIDLFLATPFGRASLFQRMFSSTLTEEIKEISASIETLCQKINDAGLCLKIKAFVHAREDQQAVIRLLAEEDEVDLLVSLMRNNDLGVGPNLDGTQITKVFLANAAWTRALDGSGDYVVADAQMYGYFSQLLKLYTRLRDKEQMTELLFDGATSNLLKDIVGIFYEPLARVYKAASIHNSIMDFSRFVDDMIHTVNLAEEQDLSTNPNALVQTFIDLTLRHQNSFFHFVHEAHLHDDGLFDGLMSWVELILGFLREGASTEIDLDAVLASVPALDLRKAVAEIDACVIWNGKIKVWRQEKLESKMAANGPSQEAMPTGALSGRDFGLDQADLDEMMYESDEEEEEAEAELDDLDPLDAELKRKKRALAKLQRQYGEPEMPLVEEVYKLSAAFKVQIRRVLAQTP